MGFAICSPSGSAVEASPLAMWNPRSSRRTWYEILATTGSSLNRASDDGRTTAEGDVTDSSEPVSLGGADSGRLA